LLNQLEFSSKRARASVIVRDPSGRILLFLKGSDSQVKKRLSPQTEDNPFATGLFNDVNDFSLEGYRTLCYGIKLISDQDYAEWSEIYNAAANAIENRETLVDSAAEQIEQNLTMLGITANEDKL
jgi:magnesium-transporting ATPase (P-type)